MSTRAQVKIISKEDKYKIYLYQHYDGYDLINTVKKAISLNLRWNDPEYLTRIIFSHMIANDVYGEYGYGIGLYEHGDITYLVVVDIDKQIIMHQEVNRTYNADYTNSKVSHKTIETVTFQSLV